MTDMPDFNSSTIALRLRSRPARDWMLNIAYDLLGSYYGKTQPDFKRQKMMAVRLAILKATKYSICWAGGALPPMEEQVIFVLSIAEKSLGMYHYKAISLVCLG
jgi:hypothetical protein